jgi:hypothetical protein
MPFTVSGTNSTGAIATDHPDAASALGKAQDMEAGGFMLVVVTDNLGRKIDRLTLITLARMQTET